MRKIDALTVRLFHSERDTTKVVTMDVLSYLDKRAASLEASPSMGERPQGKVKSTVNLSVVNKSENFKCPLCS